MGGSQNVEHNQHDIDVDQSRVPTVTLPGTFLEQIVWVEAKLCGGLWVIVRSLELTVVVMGNHWKTLKRGAMQSNLRFKKATL